MNDLNLPLAGVPRDEQVLTLGALGSEGKEVQAHSGFCPRSHISQLTGPNLNWGLNPQVPTICMTPTALWDHLVMVSRTGMLGPGAGG